MSKIISDQQAGSSIATTIDTKNSSSSTDQDNQQPAPHKVYNLLIGLSGPYGSGCSSLAEELSSILNDWPGCICERVQVSRLIKFWFPLITGEPVVEDISDEKRRLKLQQMGNKLRNEQPEIIGWMVAHDILGRGRDLEKNSDFKDVGTVVWIVDSLKNTDDLKSLRSIFKDEFFFCFVTANTETRWRRMRDYKSWKEKNKARFLEIDSIDSDQKQLDPVVEDTGQQVRKLAGEADYYIVNNETRKDLHSTAYGLVCQLIGLGINQPTRDERSMHVAFSSANQSACLSRQVGAAIFSKNGDIISIGHNDVPKAAGGLYSIEDEKHDHRCLNVGEKRCINDTNKEERFTGLTIKIASALRTYFKDLHLDDRVRDKIISQLDDCSKGEISSIILNTVKKSEFKDATEYCRAVHAEMDALLSVCRNQNGSTIGATVYVTTQPCHNCVKHLITAGVEKVVYIEPYPKSLMEELHSDAISLNPQQHDSSNGKISFLPYHGIAPRRYHDIFDMAQKRKDNDGKICYTSKHNLSFTPRFANRVEKRTREIKPDADNDLITIHELRAVDTLLSLQPETQSQEDSHGKDRGESIVIANGGRAKSEDIALP